MKEPDTWAVNIMPLLTHPEAQSESADHANDG